MQDLIKVHDYQNVHYPGQSEYVTERDVLFFNVAAVAIVEFDQSNLAISIDNVCW